MKKSIRYILISSISFILLAAAFVVIPMTKPMILQGNIHFIIDAGHGLPDGGAVGVDGTTEQKLNLQFSQKLFSKFDSDTAILIRDSEYGLSDVDGSIREKKISDMHHRIEIAHQYPNALWISVHMNTYPDASVCGCQVFYRKNDTISKSIAEAIQLKINQTVQPDHPRNAKCIDSSLYLYKNIENHTILIECGFISNAEELKNLKDETYQNSISNLIFEAVREGKINGKS